MATVQRKVEEESLGQKSTKTTRDVPPALPRDIDSYGYLRWLVSEYYSIQKHRIQAGNRASGLRRDAGISIVAEEKIREWLHSRLSKQESEIKSVIQAVLKEEPLWNEWLKGVKGVGPCIAGGIIAYISGEHYHAVTDAGGVGEIVERELEVKSRTPGEQSTVVKGRYYKTQGIETWPTVSKFWTYCGWGLTKDGLIQRRRAGQRGNWNPSVKQITWKAGESFVRTGAGYRKLYEQAKQRITSQAPEVHSLDAHNERLLGKLLTKKADKFEEGTMLTMAKLTYLRDAGVSEVVLKLRPGHADDRARRFVIKVFLAHLWQRWREILALPVKAPYVIDVLGHQSVIPVVEE